MENIGEEMYALVKKLFPICRSISGEGVRHTLQEIQQHIPITIHDVPSGTQVFDWIVPKEWTIRTAYIENEQGDRIVDFKENNLHLVGYSVPIDAYISLDKLQEHLYSLEEQPDAIPYITSYYKERWGFCLTHNQRLKLKEGIYHVYIDSDLKDGYLNYGEMILPGESEQEVLLSTYICHPSMANNELSGPVVTTFLVKWLMSMSCKYTYRIVFIPETIGSITYISRHLSILKERVISGYNITCIGDDRAYSYVPSRKGNTLADRAALNVLSFSQPEFKHYSYLDRGSDERQYCSPGVDLPVASVMRSKYGEYAEYHTSLDDLSLVTATGLFGGYEALRRCLELIEKNVYYEMKCLCEPQLGKRGLYPTLSTKKTGDIVRKMMDFIAYADGKKDLIDISNTIGISAWDLYPIIEELLAADILFQNKTVL